MVPMRGARAVDSLPSSDEGSEPVATDHDGMPDEGEQKHGLHANDARDGAKDLDGDGDTNVEECLNGTNARQFVDDAQL